MAGDVRDTATEGVDDPSAGLPREQSASEIADAARSRRVITMRDIAAVAGVSQSTVSRVLNNAPTQVPIATETRERVLRAARDVGYRPNPHARGLRGAPTLLLGVVVHDFSDLFFAAALLEGLSLGFPIVLLGDLFDGLLDALFVAIPVEGVDVANFWFEHVVLG